MSFGNGLFFKGNKGAGSGIAIDNTNPPITDINWTKHNITNLYGSNYLTEPNNAIRHIDAFKNCIFFSDAINVNGKTLGQTIICESPAGAFNNFFCIGIYLQPVSITGVGILNPIINIGNDIVVFSSVLNAYTVNFISFANTQILKPTPKLESSVSWIGKPINCNVTTVATGYTTFDFSVRLALICIP